MTKKLLLLVLLFIASVSSYAGTPFKVYMSHYGKDANNGLALNSAVQTLNRVQEILINSDPDQNIEVHISSGTYYSQSVDWSYTNSYGHSITFTPLNYSYRRPVFDGRGSTEDWFRLTKRDGKPSKLNFRYIQVQKYRHAITFHGNRNDTYSGTSENNLYGMYFYKIGSRYTQGLEPSFGAVRFINSKHNTIVNSHFVNIENRIRDRALIHAIYLSNYSSDNDVLRNRFVNVSGNPVNIRDDSNNNYIAENRFYSSGQTAYYSDWYCSPETSPSTTCGKIPECPSYGNEFRNNKLYGGYYGHIATFEFNGSNSFCGALPSPRLRTSGNVKY